MFFSDFRLIRGAMLLSKDEKNTPLTKDFINKLEELDFIIRHEQDLGKLSQKILDKVLSIFGCDRAWLLFPIDPNAKSWKIPVESCVPEYPGASYINLDIEMTQEAKETFKKAMDTEGPVEYGPEGLPVHEVSKDFNVQSQLSMAIYPRIGKPWLFGVHQCSYARIWEDNAKKLFQHIAHKVESALGNILFNMQLIEANERLEKRVTQRTSELINEVEVRKQKENELYQSEQRYRLLFENGNDALFVYHPTPEGMPSDFINVNKKACQMMGYTREELLRLSPKDLVIPGKWEEVGEIVSKRLEAGGRIFFEITLVTKNRKHLEVEISDTFFEIHGRPTVLSIVRDQTKRKQAEEEKAKMIKELQVALDEVSTLRGIIPICSNCHKIRNDKGYWQQVDQYITEHSEAVFSHGMCKQCSDELYCGQEWYEKAKKAGKIPD